MSQERIIPALSIRQPWAELILRGVKTIEIRTWSDLYRGDLYVHTGKMADGYKILDYNMADIFRGGYVGIVELVAILSFTPENWRLWQKKHLSDHPFHPGTYAWILRNPRRFERPLPAPGKLRLYQPDPEIAAVLKNIRAIGLASDRPDE
jgi:ASCH domain